MKLAAVTYLVRDYDEAREWFAKCLGFKVLEDSPLGGGKRWLLVGPAEANGPSLLLAKADGPTQVAAIGSAAGGRVAFFLHVRNFAATHKAMTDAGVRFLEAPRSESYGTVAVFEDLYGNKWDLIEPST